MNVGLAHVINATTLLLLGAWGYSLTNDPASMLPVFFGVVLLSLSNGVRYSNKAIWRIVTVLTLVVLSALIAKPLLKAITHGDTLNMIRVGIMCVTSLLALFYYTKIMITAKKGKPTL